MSVPERWLEERIAEVPEALVAWLHRSETGEEEESLSLLTARGLAALGEAIARPGRDREGAFHLLAADAYLTWACEAAAESDPDPEARLTALVERIAADLE